MTRAHPNPALSVLGEAADHLRRLSRQPEQRNQTLDDLDREFLRTQLLEIIEAVRTDWDKTADLRRIFADHTAPSGRLEFAAWRLALAVLGETEPAETNPPRHP
ncbi:hypothetical protein [Actinopolyspora halophila]|uniref:hypothetical protein n=1 Tax=Actinopolyspora halophila TaxID=1850 RepID=UPI00035ED9C3|nr:hypothetical protein [Actinopolyspora halophila]